MSNAVLPALKRNGRMVVSENRNACKCSVAAADAEWGVRGFHAIRIRHRKPKSVDRASVRSLRVQATANALRHMRFLDNRQHPECLSEQFERLADKWERETENLSSPVQMAEHPAYQQIIAMREDAIPLILQRMRERGGHWFWALSLLVKTKTDPIPTESRGKISEMTSAWLRWGYEHGYC